MFTETQQVVAFPLGQALLKAGYKKITMTDIEKRFAIADVNAKLIQNAIDKCQKFIDSLPENKRRKCFVNKDHYSSSYSVIKRTVFEEFRRVYFSVPVLECVIKTIPLESYIEEQIPNHCIEQINNARTIGIDKFAVCFPIIEDAKQHDPIVVGYLDDNNMVEVCMWE